MLSFLPRFFLLFKCIRRYFFLSYHIVFAHENSHSSGLCLNYIGVKWCIRNSATPVADGAVGPFSSAVGTWSSNKKGCMLQHCNPTQHRTTIETDDLIIASQIYRQCTWTRAFGFLFPVMSSAMDASTQSLLWGPFIGVYVLWPRSQCTNFL